MAITDLLGFLLESEPWMKEGVCRSDPKLNQDNFVLPNGASPRPGRAACARCSVTEECYDYGLKTNSVGLWGGRMLSVRTPKEPREIAVVITLQDRRPRVETIEQTGTGDHNSYPTPMAARRFLG